MGRIFSGAAAGFGATVPMTVAMIALHRQLPTHQRYPLPPRRIAMKVLRKLRPRKYHDEKERTGLTLLSHFGYGTLVGGLFGLVAPRNATRAIPAGIIYGLIVWAGSYLGLLPALRLHRPATREPEQRNALMIVAHIVWGMTLGALAAMLRSVTERDAA